MLIQPHHGRTLGTVGGNALNTANGLIVPSGSAVLGSHRSSARFSKLLVATTIS